MEYLWFDSIVTKMSNKYSALARSVVWSSWGLLFWGCNAGLEPPKMPIEKLEKTYGGVKNDVVSSILEGSDGHIWLVGRTESKGSGGDDGWILKLDKADGSVLLEKTYGGVNDDYVNSIIECRDGHIWLVGRTESKGSGGSDGWLLKLNKDDGSVLLEKTHGGRNNDHVRSIIEGSDGHIWLGGETESKGSGGADGWLLKLDKSDGRILLDKTYGGGSDDYVRSIIGGSDGHIWLGGETESEGSGGSDGWLLKLNKDNGSILLDKTYGGGQHGWVENIIEGSDGHIWLGGVTRSKGSGGWDGWLLKLDKVDGSVLLEKTYGGGESDYVSSIVEGSDGHIWLVGRTESKGSGGWDGWLLKLDKADGSVLLEKTYGGSDWDGVSGIIEGRDGHIWLGGSTWSKGSGGADGWLLGGVDVD